MVLKGGTLTRVAIILFLLIFTSFECPKLHAQWCTSLTINSCQTTIPASAIRVEGRLDTIAGYHCYWVCNGDSLFITGVELSIWVEGGGFVSIGDSINPGYACEILAEDLATVRFVGDTVQAGYPYNHIWTGPFTNVYDPKGIANRTICSSISTDYSNVSVAGCDTSLAPVVLVENMQPTPNFRIQSFNEYWLIILNSEEVSQMALMDISGREIYSNQISVHNPVKLYFQDLPPGIYFIMLEGKSGIESRAIMRE